MTKTTIKTFKTRDSATTALRKMGVNSRDYALFINKTSSGFECKIGMAEDHLDDLDQMEMRKEFTEEKLFAKPVAAKPVAAKPVAAKPVAAKPVAAKPVAAKPVATPRTGGVSHVARELIAAGKTNVEVWEVLKTRFGLDDSKKHYPAWYRSEMKRKAAEE